MRILVLVLATRFAPYPALLRTIRATWASTPVQGVETIAYRGGEKAGFGGGDLVLPVADDHDHIGRKTVASFEWAVAHREFDLIFRTNCSSYVDLPNMRDYAAEHAARDFYAGFLGTHRELPFASGSGYFLSRALTELVVERQASWRHDLLDDVALASLLATEGVRPRPAPRVTYGSLAEVVEVDTTQFHFRCRTDSRGRREDSRIMRRIHDEFRKGRKRMRQSEA